MEPNRFGRILGIGARVAADKLRERSAQAAAAEPRQRSTRTAAASTVPPASASATSGSRAPASGGPAASRPAIPSAAAIGEGSRRLARGAGRFSGSLWRPFAHATGVLWLQITGLFFAFFAVGFVGYSWQLWKASGWRDHHLPLYATFAVLFAWFAVSSFWRASRRQKRA